MINEYFFHGQLSGMQLDDLWAQGWRHFGRYFFRYSQLQQPQKHYHVLALRINLSKFLLNRRFKRALKTNQDLRVEISPAFVNDEVEDLFERHKTRFSENIPESIHVFVSKQPAFVPCTCKSVCVYKGDKLLGISYLDIGDKACSSVYQCFDPDLPKRSLGIFMMLLSIDYAKKQTMDYYYSGYAYQEASHYDYKKQFLGLESFDWNTQWLNYTLTD